MKLIWGNFTLVLLGIVTMCVLAFDTQIHLLLALSNFFLPPGASFVFEQLLAMIPTLFVTLLVARLLFSVLQRFMPRGAWIIAIAVPVGIVIFLPFQVNRVIDTELAKMSPSSIGELSKDLTADVLILQGLGTACGEICGDILVGGYAREVIAIGEDDQTAQAYRIETNPDCIPPSDYSRSTRSRMRLSNLCLVRGQSTPRQADMSLSWTEVSKELKTPVGLLNIEPGEVKAAITEIAKIEAGQATVIFSNTETQSQRLLFPLTFVRQSRNEIFGVAPRNAKYEIARIKHWPFGPNRMKLNTSFIEQAFSPSIDLVADNQLQNARDRLRRVVAEQPEHWLNGKQVIDDLLFLIRQTDQFDVEDAELLVGSLRPHEPRHESSLYSAMKLAVDRNPDSAEIFQTDALKRLDLRISQQEDLSSRHLDMFSLFPDPVVPGVEDHLPILEDREVAKSNPNLVKVLAYAGEPALVYYFDALAREFDQFNETSDFYAANNILLGLCFSSSQFPEEVELGIVELLADLTQPQKLGLWRSIAKTFIGLGWSREQIMQVIWGSNSNDIHRSTLANFDSVIGKAASRSTSEHITPNSHCH